MKKNLLLIALACTIGLISCNNDGMNGQNGQMNGKMRSGRGDCNKKSCRCKSCGCSNKSACKREMR